MFRFDLFGCSVFDLVWVFCLLFRFVWTFALALICGWLYGLRYCDWSLLFPEFGFLVACVVGLLYD